MNTLEWITLGSSFVTIVLATLGLWWQLRKLSVQLMIQQFSDYTKRYQEIILHFPENINEPEFMLASSHERASTMRYMRAYFDLCFEEWYLNQRKLIDKDIWKTWRAGMSAALSKSAFRQAWDEVKKDTDFGREFVGFVENVRSERRLD